VLGAFNTDLKENDAFVYLADHLKKSGNKIPEIYAVEREKGIYLLEDLGRYHTARFYTATKAGTGIWKKPWMSIVKS